ncbi:MAG: crosslink repair DNA glycosylase YcaQ family protein, partial [Chloroflexota bacterium]
MVKLSAEEARALRLRAQGLQPQYPREKLVEAVGAVVGIQAQLASAMQLALRARINGLTLKDVNEAVGESRSLVRSWLMRGTLHLIPSDDLYWINALLSPTLIVKGKGRRAQLGLDDETAAKGLKAIREILSDGEP